MFLIFKGRCNLMKARISNPHFFNFARVEYPMFSKQIIQPKLFFFCAHFFILFFLFILPNHHYYIHTTLDNIDVVSLLLASLAKISAPALLR